MSAQPLVILDDGRAAVVLGLPGGVLMLAVREAWNRATAEQLYSVEEVAEILGCSVRKVWGLVDSRDLAPTHLVGRQRRIPDSAVVRYQAARAIP